MQHNDGWPFTANSDVNRRAISFDLFDAETGWESGNFCHGVISTTGTPDSFASVTGFVGLDNRLPLQLALTLRSTPGCGAARRELSGSPAFMIAWEIATQSEGCALR